MLQVDTLDKWSCFLQESVNVTLLHHSRGREPISYQHAQFFALGLAEVLIYGGRPEGRGDDQRVVG
jgi:hypothetical protein